MDRYAELRARAADFVKGFAPAGPAAGMNRCETRARGAIRARGARVTADALHRSRPGACALRPLRPWREIQLGRGRENGLLFGMGIGALDALAARRAVRGQHHPRWRASS